MAISVDKVYQKVLATANKEQRGYITPQEFNLFADHAQMEIFNQYFYDVDQFTRRMADDTDQIIKHKIEIFKKASVAINESDELPTNLYLIESVFLDRLGETHKSGPLKGERKKTFVEKIDRDKSNNIYNAFRDSPLLTPSKARPIYWLRSNQIFFMPSPSFLTTTNTFNAQYYLNYIRNPKKPNWTYVIDPINQSALYNPDASNHQNFELHISEETKLVIKILQLAGVSMKDYGLTQVAGQKEAGIVQQEKQ